MGHASIATTNLYLHHLGTPADRAGLARLNAPGHAGAQEKRRGQNDKGGTPPDLARLRCSDGFPVGWRKDDGEVTSPESDVASVLRLDDPGLCLVQRCPGGFADDWGGSEYSLGRFSGHRNGAGQQRGHVGVEPGQVKATP